MKILKIFISLTFLIVFACKPEAKDVTNLSVIDLQTRISDSDHLQILDVRTQEECVNGIIEKSINIDVTADGFEQLALQRLDKTKPVYVYCRSGGRSLIASEILKKQGFKVYNVEGGYMDWLDKIKK